MSNFVVILKIFPGIDTCYLIHYAKNTVSVNEQKLGDHQWTVNKHFNLPMSLIDVIKILHVQTAILEKQGFPLAGHEKTQREYVFDFSVLHPTIRKKLSVCKISCVFLYDNQQR